MISILSQTKKCIAVSRFQSFKLHQHRLVRAMDLRYIKLMHRETTYIALVRRIKLSANDWFVAIAFVVKVKVKLNVKTFSFNFISIHCGDQSSS